MLAVGDLKICVKTLFFRCSGNTYRGMSKWYLEGKGNDKGCVILNPEAYSCRETEMPKLCALKSLQG